MGFGISDLVKNNSVLTIKMKTKGLFICLPKNGMPFSNVPFGGLSQNFGAKIMARYFGNKMACHF